MDLLATEEPVFVVDLTPATMEACRVDFASPDLVVSETRDSPGRATTALVRRRIPGADRPIRAIALVFSWAADPVLLAIRPTRDTVMLDALARLLRTALLTGESLAHLATEHGDDQMRRMYFAKQFPRFVYRGIPAPVRSRLPERIVAAMGQTGRRRS